MESPQTSVPLMSVWACPAYGAPDVLRREMRPRPVVRAHEVMVRVAASTITAADSRIRRAVFPRGFGLLGRLALGVTRPRRAVLGTECAGVIAEVGAKAGPWRVGAAVVAVAGVAMGCHAEYRCFSADGLVVAKPDALSMEEAASLPFGGLTALHFLRRATVVAGERVLIIGASGSVGTACVQLARFLGAEVTGVCSAANTVMVRSLGAHHVVAYTDSVQAYPAATYDVIVDCVAAGSFAALKASLREGGRYVSVAGGLREILPRRDGSRRSFGGVVEESRERLTEVLDLTRQGQLRPVIDRIYPFDELPAAHAYVDTGRKRGAVVIRVS